MDVILILIILFVAFFVLVAPILALAKASDLARRCERLEERINSLEEALQAQKRKDAAQNEFRPAPANVSTPPRPPQPAPPVFEGEEPASKWETLGMPSLSEVLPKRADPPLPPPIPPARPVLEPTPAFASPTAESASVPPPLPPPLAPAPEPVAFDWERFLGVKLFAWVGGLALFLGIAFALKYSFEKGLISPLTRVIMGSLFGVGLLIGGLRLSRLQYAVTVEVLCATGVLVLYADIFAANSFYHLIPLGAAFGLMTLVTAAAFILAVRLDGPAVAVLGLVGGFLTPFLLSSGQDNPLGLFGYIALLDAGLIAITGRKRWGYLLLLGALGTVIMEWGWVFKFFEAFKIATAMTVFIGFAWFFLASCGWVSREKAVDKYVASTAFLLPGSAFVFGLYLMLHPYSEIAGRPGLLFGYLFLVDLGLLGLAWRRDEFRAIHLAAGAAMFGLMSIWTMNHLTNDLLMWSLGFYLLFALCHTLYPLVLEKLRPGQNSKHGPAWFPILSMGLILLPMFRLDVAPLSIWPAALLVDLLAMAVACVTLSMAGVVAVLLLTMVGLGAWILKMSTGVSDLSALIGMTGGFAVFFFAASLLLLKKFLPQIQAKQKSNEQSGGETFLGLPFGLADQIPAIAVTMPFLLLVMVISRLTLTSPTPVFALGTLLSGLLFGLIFFDWSEVLGAIALAGVLLMEFTWQSTPEAFQLASTSIGWHVFFFVLFLGVPFILARRRQEQKLLFTLSALAGPVHFFFVWRVVAAAYPHFQVSFLSLAFALPYLATTAIYWRMEAGPLRLSRLAWHAGVALFFITLFVPMEYRRQWLTIGWALEGAALLWLFHRVPHSGLPWVATGLLIAAFARLALNFETLHYYPRNELSTWNWFLYAYGLVILCLFLGARLLPPPRNRLGGTDVPPILRGMGAVLLFLLLNIEIACHYSTGTYIEFEFSGNLERDMAYSLAWAAFAFVLLVFGIRRKVVSARYAGLALLSVTLLKLFFHDLWRLGGLYRIGALVGLAVVSIPVSYLYQRFMAAGTDTKTSGQ